MRKQQMFIWTMVAMLVGGLTFSGFAGQTTPIQTSRQGAKSLNSPSQAAGFHFIIFGDRTGGDITEGTQVWRQAIEQANRMRPDFVCTVGDLIWGYDDRQSWLQEADDINSDLQALHVPFFPVAGNHDIYWNRNTQNRPKEHHESEYETHFGPLWYAFEYQNCWFVCLFSDEGDPDSGEKGSRKPETQIMSDRQFNWLKEILNKARGADHVILFLHHPRWTGGGYGDDWDKVHAALLQAGNVSAVFAGHLHKPAYSEIDGIDYYTLGTTGGVIGKQSTSQQHLFYWVSVQDDAYQITGIPVGQVIDPKGPAIKDD